MVSLAPQPAGLPPAPPSHVLAVYNRADFTWARGEGCRLFDDQGRAYLDFANGIAVTSLGHCHPRLVQALTDQAQKLWLCGNGARIPGQERLADRLCALSGLDRVFFTNSGVEAWEAGLKLIRRHFHEKGQTRPRVITLRNSFHGRTMAAISASGQEKLIHGFGPLLESFQRVEPEDIAGLTAAMGPDVAAICLEPVTGEGGVIALSDAYLRGARDLCDRQGALLFLDEVQCGMGRTGRLFAHQWSGIKPDVMAIAKAMGGGFPVGACLVTEAVADTMPVGAHGTTYGGNPLAMAVANAVLDVMLEPDFLPRVEAMSAVFERHLADLCAHFPKLFVERRGRGLMRGLRLAPDLPNTQFVARARSAGLLIVQAHDNLVRLLPALIVGEAELQEAAAKLAQAAQG